MQNKRFNHPIGVIVDSFRKGLVESIEAAKAVGADGIQVYAVRRELKGDQMDAAAKRDFRALLEKLDLRLAALCGDLGGHGFMIAADNPQRVETSKLIVDLAVDLGTNIVTTHVGVIPEDNQDSTYKTILEACRELGEYAASRKVSFAIETGPESPETLRSFLDELATPGVGVNYDPANLVMVGGYDPVEGVRTLAPYIVHTHAKDGRKLAPCSAADVYNAFAEKTYKAYCKSLGGEPFIEVPLGEGSVNWDAYLSALYEAGYRGFLTIEREVGDDPATDIANAVRFLRAQTMPAG